MTELKATALYYQGASSVPIFFWGWFCKSKFEKRCVLSILRLLYVRQGRQLRACA